MRAREESEPCDLKINLHVKFAKNGLLSIGIRNKLLKLQLTPLLDNGIKMTSKRRSFILLIFIIKCISKCALIRFIIKINLNWNVVESTEHVHCLTCHIPNTR